MILFFYFLITSFAYGQITVLREQQHLAIIKEGQKTFLERDDYMNDKIFEITEKEDTVIVLEADKTFFKFKKDTLVAWSLTAQLDEYKGIFTNSIIYDIKTPFKHVVRSDIYAYDQPEKMAKKILDLKKGEIVTVVNKANEFFEIKYKDRKAFVIENAILPNQVQHPISKALSESTNVNTIKTTKPKSSGRTYYSGPRGGCYYINSAGKKVYVDHSYCN